MNYSFDGGGSARASLHRAVSSMESADFRWFSIALLVTQMGAHALQTATLWQVYQLTGSPLLLGLTGLAKAVPHITLSLAGGVIADRVNRVRLIQAGQVANASLTFLLAALTLTGTVEVWHLYAVTFLNAAFTAVTQPARNAMIPSLVPGGNLVNAIALSSTIQQMAQIVGPAVAGIAIGLLGLGETYVINGAAYVLGVLALAQIGPRAALEMATESPWESLGEGLGFVRRRPVIISLLALDLGETLFGSYRPLLPLLAGALGAGPEGYGLLSAAPGVGSVLGATGILSLGDMRYKGLYTVFGVLSYCVALVVLALSPWFLLSLAAGAALGAANSFQVIPRNTVILAITPDLLRGRVEAFRSMVAGGGPPVGFVLAGVVAAAFGAQLALMLGAGACAVTVASVALTRRELRDRDLGDTPRARPRDRGEPVTLG